MSGTSDPYDKVEEAYQLPICFLRCLKLQALLQSLSSRILLHNFIQLLVAFNF